MIYTLNYIFLQSISENLKSDLLFYGWQVCSAIPFRQIVRCKALLFLKLNFFLLLQKYFQNEVHNSPAKTDEIFRKDSDKFLKINLLLILLSNPILTLNEPKLELPADFFYNHLQICWQSPGFRILLNLSQFQ